MQQALQAVFPYKTNTLLDSWPNWLMTRTATRWPLLTARCRVWRRCRNWPAVLSMTCFHDGIWV